MKNIEESLAKLRKVIDNADNELLNALKKRQDAVTEIGKLKKMNNLPVLDSKRWNEVLQSRIKLGEKYGLPEKLVKTIYEAIHEYSLQTEEKIKK